MCAATNPMRSSDLIAKFGWKVMPYLSNLGPQLLSEAQVLFVDSGHTNTLDADDGEHGMSFEVPLATIDYAIDLCTAEERSVILVAPGHVETLGAATIDFDVSDITVIGIGEGSNKPKVVFGNAASSVDIGANNIHLVNLRFVPSVTDVLIGVDIETTITGTLLENCEFAEGDTIATDEFITALAVKATCTDTHVKNCLFRTGLAADGATAAIQLTGISDNVVIEKSRFIGNWGTAAIYNDSGVCTDLLIDDCTMKVADGLPGISVVSTTTGIIRNVAIESTGLAVDSMIVAADMAWFNNFGVTVDGSAAELIGGGEVNAQIVAHGLDHLVTLADGAAAYPASVVADSIIAMILSKAAQPVATSYVNTTDSLEAISDKVSLGTDIRNPNAAFAEVYWVDADSGSDANDGLSPENAFATLAVAIAANNVAFAADSDPQRTMYIHSKTYTENLTTWPENCTMIGIGGKVRIQGYHTISHTQNLRIHNIQFRSNQVSVPILDVTGNCHGLTLDKCVFDSQAAISECVKFTGSQSDIVINNCRMGYETNAAYSPAIGIRFAGVHAQRGEVTNNRIFVRPITGIGIQIDSTMVSGNFLLIKENVIMGSPASDDQCAVGIKDLTASPRGGIYVHNWISAIDGMYFTVAGNKSAWLSMDNIVNENGSSLREDSLV